MVILFPRFMRRTARRYQKMGANVLISPSTRVTDNLIVRYGYTGFSRGDIELNNVEAIHRSHNKILTLRLLQENGVNTVPFSLEPDLEGPVLCRMNYRFGGKGIRYATMCIPGYDFYTKYINKEREYRFHVAGKRIIMAQEKIGDTSKIIWNHRNGFVFRQVKTSTIDNEIINDTLRSMDIIDLDFGAIDIIEDGNGYYIMEVNSAPGAWPLVASKYLLYFNLVEQSGNKDILTNHTQFFATRNIMEGLLNEL